MHRVIHSCSQGEAAYRPLNVISLAVTDRSKQEEAFFVS